MKTVNRPTLDHVVATVLSNARRLGTNAFHTAAALDMLAPIDGRRWSAVCVWCLESDSDADAPVHRVGADASGGCERCSYAGRDTLVAATKR